jgi:hypothetical protein
LHISPELIVNRVLAIAVVNFFDRSTIGIILGQAEMERSAKLRILLPLGTALLTLAGCLEDTDSLGQFDGNGRYTKAQKKAVSNCLDVARRSARSFGYAAPKGNPDEVTPNGEFDYAFTWKFDKEPGQYQCIVRRKTGEAYEYFWG